jgi:broad specificity phosphatase PhoE
LRLIVIRHAQTIWNAEGKIQGQADPELSETGRRQCELVAERLASATIDALYTSDLSRARETAAAVASRHPGLSAQPDAGLREIDLGAWEGATRETLQAAWPDLYDTWLKRPSWDLVPDGEGGGAFQARVLETFSRIAATADEVGSIVVVTHIGVIRTLLSTIVGAPMQDPMWPWAIGNTSLTLLQGPTDVSLWPTPAMEILAINDTRHLRQRPRPGAVPA